MDQVGHNTCAHCGAAADSHCGKCKTTKYCGTKCQKAAWPNHKDTCGRSGTELVVYRAAQLLQDVYLLMREMTFDNSIESVEDRGEYLQVRDKPMIPGTIFPFPGHLVRTEEEKRMVLTTLICQEPIAYLHDFLLETLKDTGVTLEEHTLRLKKPIKTVNVTAQMGDLDMNKFKHSVVRVKSSNGAQSWIIDVSGAQYSIFEACLKEKIYRKRHVIDIYGAYQPGTNKAIRTMKRMKGDGALMARIGWFAAEKIYAAISQWKINSGRPLYALMQKSEGAFLAERKKTPGGYRFLATCICH